MKRLKRRISIVTLTIFLLMTFVSGFGSVLANDKAPVSKGQIAKPAIDRSGGGGEAAPSDQQSIASSYWNDGRPHLDSLKVNGEEIIDDKWEAVDQSHTVSIPYGVNTATVSFKPHATGSGTFWSEWWLGPAFPVPEQKNHVEGSAGNNRDIGSINLDYETKVITIRVCKRTQILTVTVTLVPTLCPDTPHLDSLKVNGQELITDPSKKRATSHSITVDAEMANIVFDPHKADWSEWWIGTPEERPETTELRHRDDDDVRTIIPDVALQDGDNIVTIRVGDHAGGYDKDILPVTLTITKPASTVPVTGVSLDKTTLDLKVGGSDDLTATIVPPDATNQNVTWSVEPAGVVTLSGSGLTRTVTAGSTPGTATVTVTTEDGGKTATCAVRVWDLTLDKTNLEMTAGGNTRTLTATPWPDNSIPVSWVSSDTDVATVVGGVVDPGEVAGTADITASININGLIIVKTCTVYVRNPLDLFVVGEPTLKPDGTYEATFGYTSEYTGVTIDDLLTQNKLDNALEVNPSLPAAFSNGTHNAFTATYLHSKPAVWTVIYDGVTSSVTAGIEQCPKVNVSPSTLDLVVNGSSKDITVTISRPKGFFMTQGDTTSDIVWSIVGDGGKYIEINGSGQNCRVTPKDKAGTAVVKATFAGGKSDTCTVKVWDLSLDKGSLEMTAGGNTRTIKATTKPGSKTVSWSSSNNWIAAVNNGVVTPKHKGTATITASITVGDETIEKTCTVDVRNPLKVFVSDPVLNQDGTYTATFGYESDYSGPVTIQWGLNNLLLNGGHALPPKTFVPDGDEDAFTVNYLHSDLIRPTWSVKYDGVRTTATAGKLPYDEIDINVLPEKLELIAWGDSEILTASTEQIELPGEQTLNFFGPTSDIKWTVEQEGNIINDYNNKHRGQNFTVCPRDPGIAYVTAQFANGDSATCEVTVIDPRTISLSPASQNLRARRDPGTLIATIGNVPDIGAGSQYDWGITWSTEQTTIIKLEPGTDGTCSVVPLKGGYATVTAALANGQSASALVRVRSINRQDEPQPEPAPAALPETPLPPALETFDVTVTIGSTLAIVNGQEVMLAGNPLLIGADRAMVDYADMALLIPGLEVTWDWQTLSVTFSKDGQELTMVLDVIPADFDVPFMNIGGRLVVPVRYVGSFFGATVDWIGDTLVVHMYK